MLPPSPRFVLFAALRVLPTDIEESKKHGYDSYTILGFCRPAAAAATQLTRVNTTFSASVEVAGLR